MERRRLSRPQRVLIVDDNADLRHVWREWLTRWQFEVHEADNGLTAIEKARSSRPALVIMDLTMPELDGLGATNALRSHPATAQLPVIMLSADSHPAAATRAKEAGCEAFLAKPIPALELLEEIRGVFRRVICVSDPDPDR